MANAVLRFVLLFSALLLFSACIADADTTLPHDTLPELIVAAPFDLVASPSHPTAYLLPEQIPAGEQLEVIGADPDSAWLLILYNGTLGWMPSFFSATNIATLQPAITIDPLPDSCTKYLGSTLSPEEGWISTVDGPIIVQGSIYRPLVDVGFEQAEIVINLLGTGEVQASDYLHIPLTVSSALILFTASIADIEKGSEVWFDAIEVGNEPLSYGFSYFSDTCGIDYAGSPFQSQLPIGTPKTDVETLPAIREQAFVPETIQATVESSLLRVITLQQRVPLTVTLYIPPSISGTHTVQLPLNVNFQLRIDQNEVITASASLVDRSRPVLLPSPRANTELLGPRQLVYTPAPSQLQPGRLGPTDVCGDITEDTIWEAEASPYVVNCNVTIKPGVTLSIAPGTVVKFARRSGLYVDDTLQVLGTEELPVFFTSLVDDSVSGDTNGDGSQNLPVAGGWDFVQFNARSNDDNSIIEHLVIRYSGGDQGVGAIRLQNASPILRNISFEKNRLNGAEIATNLLESDVWDNTDVVYVLLSSATIGADQTLTIAPGMVVKFGRRSGLYVDDTLQILGTEELPVFFTSLVDDSVGGDTNGDGSQNLPVAGGWDFVQFNARSNDDNSIIEHLDIRYSGGDQGVGAIRLQNASPILRDVSFENNRINGVEIATNLLESDVWDNTDVVYVLLSSATIGADQTLTIAPGMVVKFGRRSGLYVDDTLQILGTEQLPVFFTSLVDDSVGGDTNGDGSQSLPVAGGWDFVQFNARSNDDNSAIEHLVIRYSGSDQGFGAIRLQNASPILRDISFEKNRVNGAEIATPSLESDVWDNTGVVYVILSNVTIPPDQALTITPGMVVKFARRAGLYVDDTLQVLGTAEIPIYFTSLADDSIGGDTNGDGSQSLPTAGGWDFLQFNARSDDGNSLIEYVVIRYGGGDRNYGAIRLQNVSPALSNVDFLDNARDEVEILN